MGQEAVGDPRGAAGAAIDVNDDPGDTRVAVGHLEPRRARGEKAMQRQVGPRSDDRVVGPGHTDVRTVGGSGRQQPRVGGGNVGVGAEHRADATVRVPTHAELFGGRLGVEVEHGDGGGVGDLLEDLVEGAKGAVDRRHEHPPLKVDDDHGLPGSRAPVKNAAAGAPRRVVGGPQQARLTFEILVDATLRPDVISGREHIDAQGQQVVGEISRDAAPRGDVLAVDDGEINLVARLDVRQPGLQDTAARLAHDIADEQ